jgi:hypothetical protein
MKIQVARNMTSCGLVTCRWSFIPPSKVQPKLSLLRVSKHVEGCPLCLNVGTRRLWDVTFKTSRFIHEERFSLPIEYKAGRWGEEGGAPELVWTIWERKKYLLPFPGINLSVVQHAAYTLYRIAQARSQRMPIKRHPPRFDSWFYSSFPW